MIREDYILAWVRRYVQWLLEIIGLVKQDDHEAAFRRIDQALRALLEIGADSVTSLSEGEVLARLTLGEPDQPVREKCVLIAAVLKQLGLVFAAQQLPERSRDCQLLALHVVLGLKLRGEAGPLADYLPTVDGLLEPLKAHLLPPRTYGALLLFHERNGQFAQAEDALFNLLEAAPGEPTTLEVGVAFYERLLVLSDEALAAGDLPRTEVQAGLAELGKRLAAMRGGQPQ